MKFLIGFLVTIGLLIVVFILIFRGAANNDNKAAEQIKLVDYATTSTVVEMTQMGPVQADQTFNSVRVTVSNQETAFEAFTGYNGNTIRSQTFANNSTAYADFLRALDLAGYQKGNNSKNLQDYRGACATGTRYIFRIKDNGETKQEFWSSSCKGMGNFQGTTNAVVRLFHAQVPGYNALARNLNLATVTDRSATE